MVPAHHIFDIHPVTSGDTGKRIAFTDTIGNAIAIVCQSLRAAASAYGQALPDFQARTTQVVPLLQVLRAYAKPRSNTGKRIARAHLIATAIQRRIVGDQLGLNGVNLTGSQRLTQLLGMLLGTITYCGPLTPKVDPFTPALNVFSLLIDMPAISATGPFQLDCLNELVPALGFHLLLADVRRSVCCF